VPFLTSPTCGRVAETCFLRSDVRAGFFPKQLGTTIHEAALKPITEGLGGMIASAIHPVIYGTDGQGGLAGIFHGAFGGKQDPVKVSTDMNTAATMQNSAAVATLMAIFASFMGVAAPALASPLNLPGVSLPSISIPAAGGAGASLALPAAWGGASAAPWAAAGGTAGEYSPAPWAAGGYSPASWNPLSTIMRGGTVNQPAAGTPTSIFSKGGFSSTLSNLKGMVWNQDAWDKYPWTTGGEIAGGIEGVASSPVAGAAGLSLATRGLISNAGTWTGAIQGAAGGALIGNQIGGPLGAAAGRPENRPDPGKLQPRLLASKERGMSRPSVSGRANS